MATNVRYPLAFDADGNPLELPQNALAWRVRRGGGKRGRPRIVFDNETGRQLEVPLAATIDDLIERGCTPGRYRLEAVDQEGRTIPGVVAVTEISADSVEAEAEEFNGDFAAYQLKIIAHQNDTVCRALEALAAGYNPIASLQQPQHPVVISQGGASGGGLQPEQIAQLIQQGALAAKMLVDAWKGGRGGGGGGEGEGGNN